MFQRYFLGTCDGVVVVVVMSCVLAALVQLAAGGLVQWCVYARSGR